METELKDFKKEIMITTTDNPYDPYEQWNEWLLFDHLNGYHTNERLASITFLSDQLTDSEIYDTIENSIDQLIKTGAISKTGETIEFKKVKRDYKTVKQQ